MLTKLISKYGITQQQDGQKIEELVIVSITCHIAQLICPWTIGNKPMNMLPASPRKILAGLKLYGKKPKVEPAKLRENQRNQRHGIFV